MPEKVHLNQVIDFILNSDVEVITTVCEIAMSSIMVRKFEIPDAKKACQELESFFQETATLSGFEPNHPERVRSEILS